MFSDTAFDGTRIVPVITIRDPAHAVALARALAAGGIRVVEIVLRSEAALESIRCVAREVPEVTVGAGTVLTAQDVARSVAAGAKFLVSPGLTEALAKAVREHAARLLPGAATASEIMRGVELGFDRFKLFPAEAAGGVVALKAFFGPFPSVCFCPTGGITPSNLADYLSQPNVFAVGGSWMIPAGFDPARDCDRVTELARAAVTAARSM